MLCTYVTCRQFYEQVYFVRHLAGGKETTHSDYRLQLSWLERYWKHKLEQEGLTDRPLGIHDLSAQIVGEAMAWRKSKKRSNGTCNKLYRFAKALWNEAHEEGKVEGRFRQEPYPENKISPECWSPEEFEKIVNEAAKLKGYVGDVPAGLWFLALLFLVYNTGTRISAIMATPTRNLDLTRGEILIPASHQKQKADQRHKLMPQTIEYLSAIHPERVDSIFDDWTHDRTQRGWRALTKRLKRILTAAGLPATKRHLFHKIRRTTITFVAVKLGRGTAQQVGGHSDPKVTDGYIDPRFTELPRLDQVLPQPKLGVQLRLWRPDDTPPDQGEQPAKTG